MQRKETGEEERNVMKTNEKPETKVCKYCKTEIPYGAKICPNCRKKQGGKAGFVVLAVLAVAIIGAMGGGKKETGNASASAQSAEKTAGAENAGDAGNGSAVETEAPIEYAEYSVDTMMDDLDANAMNASDKYKGQKLRITGKLSTIDSDGKYISLRPQNKDFAITGVQCYFTSQEQKDRVKEMTSGDIVTLSGTCKKVGEVLGYTLDIDEIE